MANNKKAKTKKSAKRSSKGMKKSSGKRSLKEKIARGDLTIHFMPYSTIANDDALGKIKKIMGIILQNKVILLQGKLKSEEESKLIEHTMTLIGNIQGFQGVEIATISNDSERNLFNKIRHNIARILIGEHDAITIIGPASVVKEIQRDPKKIEFMLKRR